eukprot:Protomagalhaensia_sp_Gyna_25__409@NODE_1193_length_2080_cov_18_171485_g948_i0_p1_GENE_NODE_1193_length_2080_cov_18_171485_g948_i0NODE_1193_length_2080_cov_18_171485_g948_i0_p1_ORF_typecomplete_len464_score42_59CRTlike/PF08627_10/3_2e14CRTlike/PF08627_10/0_72UAA/PF08449_11/3_4e03UAA/PF08449_11/7_9e07Nuc_sug_transp/PF04142_15/0_00023SLC35F/PF06027_12/0_004SLC35F/PF06027_12/2_8TPT/PF03151_16/0_0047EamA/PF00892_20/2_6e03EamA/PF00892_20/6_5e02EamA/PF00892_20/0_0021EamA/PF00892_20/0_4Mg_trans_NIPA/PF0
MFPHRFFPQENQLIVAFKKSTMSVILGVSLLFFGGLESVGYRVKSILLQDLNIISVVVDGAAILAILGILVYRHRHTLASEGQFAFFWRRTPETAARTLPTLWQPPPAPPARATTGQSIYNTTVQTYYAMKSTFQGWPPMKYLVLISLAEVTCSAVIAVTQPRVPGPIDTVSGLTIVVWVALLSYWLLGSAISRSQVVGIVVILAGAWFASIGSMSPDPIVRPLKRSASYKPVESRMALGGIITMRLLALGLEGYAIVAREHLMHLFERRSEQKRYLSIPLVCLGVNFFLLLLSPLVVAMGIWISRSDGDETPVMDTFRNGLNCIMGESSSPHQNCTDVPPTYMFYLIVSLTSQLVSLAYLEMTSALATVILAQLVGPVTLLMFAYLPVPILKAEDRRVTAMTWIGMGLIIAGQLVYEFWAPKVDSEETQPLQMDSPYCLHSERDYALHDTPTTASPVDPKSQ